MFSLYLSLALLGLAAIDPIGIGIMPFLLAQKQPYSRASIFLSGSFVSLVSVGLLFTKGLGQSTLHFERTNQRLIPAIEAVAATILFIIAARIYAQLKSGKVSFELSQRMRRQLKLNKWHLFFSGFLLVLVQSILDVVFVVAMIRVGQSRLSNLTLTTAIATYAIAALAFQLMVVGAFWLAPPQQKDKTLRRIRGLLTRYSNQALIVVSLGLSLILFTLAIVR